jgi:hypothetical protein
MGRSGQGGGDGSADTRRASARPVAVVSGAPVRPGMDERVIAWGSVVGMDAAVRALVASRWLDDPAFVVRCVVVLRGEPPAAMVDWLAAQQFLARQRPHGDPGAVAALASAIELAARAQGGQIVPCRRESSW